MVSEWGDIRVHMYVMVLLGQGYEIFSVTNHMHIHIIYVTTQRGRCRGERVEERGWSRIPMSPTRLQSKFRSKHIPYTLINDWSQTFGVSKCLGGWYVAVIVEYMRAVIVKCMSDGEVYEWLMSVRVGDRRVCK